MNAVTGIDIRFEQGYGENRTIAVLGCGPAGLLAAHAAKKSGFEPVIFSAAVEKSEMPGAIFLHEPIPDIAVPQMAVRFQKRGTREGYAAKVYGDPRARCSWDAFEDGEERPAYSMRLAYDLLWDLYADRICPMKIDPIRVEALDAEFPFVISTIPAPALCSEDHEFASVPIYINAGVGPVNDPSVIIYNGDPAVSWYRASYLWGNVSFEFGAGVHGRPDGCVEGKKPLGHSCDCFPEVLRAGRFGQWERGVLVHHVYPRVEAALISAFEEL